MFDKIFGAVKSIAGWAKTIPSEPNGNGSSSRVIALIIAATIAGLLISFFYVKHELPTAEQLYGLAAILGTGIGSYVANKFRRGGAEQSDEGDHDSGDNNAKP